MGTRASHALAAALLSLVAALSFTGVASAKRLPFGFNEDYAFKTAGAKPEEKVYLTHVAGGGIARMSLEWRCVEPGRDFSSECWRPYEEIYHNMRLQGLTPVITLMSAPVWAQAHPCQRDLGYCSIPPARRHDAEWREFAAEAARRMPNAVFEIWNEPNLRAFWNGRPRPRRYAELVRLAHGGITSTSSQAKLLAGGVLATKKSSARFMPSRAFFRRALHAGEGLRRRVDGISYHMYGLSTGLGPGSYFRAAVKEMRRTAKRHLPRRRERLWLTETGVSTAFPESLTPRQQKRRLYSVWRKLDRIPMFRGLIFHRLTHPGADDAAFTEWQKGMAWLHHRPLSDYPKPIQPRPVFCRFANAAGPGYPPCRD